MSKKRRIKIDEKIRIAKECISGKMSQSEAESQAGVSKTAADWIKVYNGHKEFKL